LKALVGSNSDWRRAFLFPALCTGVIGIGFCIVWLFSQFAVAILDRPVVFLSDHPAEAVIFGLPALACALLCVLSWRIAVWALMIWLTFGDLLRKSLPHQPPQVLLVADALVGLAYLGYLWSGSTGRRCEGFRASRYPLLALSLTLFSAVCVVEVFNPKSPNLWYGLVGLHGYLWCVPLMWLGGAMFGDWPGLRKFVLVICAFAIPAFLLAVYQYHNFETLPPALHSIGGDFDYHTYEAQGTSIKLVCSTFANAEKYARFCTMVFFLSIALAAEKTMRFAGRVLVFTSGIAALGGLFLSGRRAPLYLTLLGGFVLAAKLGPRLRSFALRTATAVLLLALLVVFLAANLDLKDTESYYRNSLVTIGERATAILAEFDEAVTDAGWLGHGTGTDSMGVTYLPGGQTQATAQGNWIEYGLPKLWWELGPAGAFSFAFFFGSVLLALWLQGRSNQNNPRQPVCFTYLVYVGVIFIWFMKGHQILGDMATLVHLWFFTGVVLSSSATGRVERAPDTSAQTLRAHPWHFPASVYPKS
jgi:hypothetical protein